MKKCIENVFKALNKDLEADMELYVQPVKSNKYNWGNQPLKTGVGRKHLIY